MECIDYTSIHFLMYVGRWVLSAFVMMIPLYLIKRYTKIKSEYVHLVLVQIVGAFIFYKIDAYIFQ